MQGPPTWVLAGIREYWESRAFWATHPTLERRCAQLDRMERELQDGADARPQRRGLMPEALLGP